MMFCVYYNNKVLMCVYKFANVHLYKFKNARRKTP